MEEDKRLVLNRRLGESVLLEVEGKRVRICVHELARGGVQLVFDAPLEVKIWREELGEYRRPRSTEEQC